MSIYANFLTDGYVSGFDGLLIREFGFRESSARLAFALTRLDFVTSALWLSVAFVASKAIKSQFARFLM